MPRWLPERDRSSTERSITSASPSSTVPWSPTPTSARTSNTQYEIGSLTKTFTALRLADVTLAELASHHSGSPRKACSSLRLFSQPMDALAVH